MKVAILATFLAFGTLAACGGDDGGDRSGVDNSKAVTDLEASEVSALCEWGIDVQGGEDTTTECESFSYSVGTVAECEAEYAGIPAGCSVVTVGELEACLEVLGDDPCTGLESEACAEFLACSFGGS